MGLTVRSEELELDRSILSSPKLDFTHTLKKSTTRIRFSAGGSSASKGMLGNGISELWGATGWVEAQGRCQPSCMVVPHTRKKSPASPVNSVQPGSKEFKY